MILSFAQGRTPSGSGFQCIADTCTHGTNGSHKMRAAGGLAPAARERARVPMPRSGLASARFAVPLAALALVALYAAQVAVAGLSHRDGTRPLYAAVMLLSGGLESLALLALYRGLAGATARATAWLVAGAAGMLLLSLVCANTDVDAYAYVGYAKLAGFHDAYLPPATAFGGPGFGVINAYWGPRLPALDYGPLWLVFDRLAVGWAPSYATALLVLRICNVVFLIALLAALRQLGFARPLLAVVALNPMLWFYYVVQAHNDLMAILLVVAGAALAQRRPLLGALVAGCAGLVKITFVALAVLAYAGRRRPPATILYLALSLALTAAVSAAFGGADYLHAMLATGHEQLAARSDLLHAVGVVLHLCVAAVAGIALLWAIARGEFAPPATYGFSAISTIFYPWYLGWCIPYALRVPRFAAWFFIALPALAHALDPHFSLYERHTFAVLDPYYAVVLVFVVRHLWLARRRGGAERVEVGR